MSPTTIIAHPMRLAFIARYGQEVGTRPPDEVRPFGRGQLLTYIHQDGTRSLLYRYAESDGEAHLVAHVPAS